MPKKGATVPDAWDDDWDSQADKADREAEARAAANAAVEEKVKISKTDRIAKHKEENKKLWDSAETPETFHFLAAQQAPPLKSDFKPALKLLSRKPAPRTTTVIDAVTGLERIRIEDDDEDEEDMKKNVLSAEQRKEKARVEREEKQRKYEEVRARLFGTEGSRENNKGNASGTSSPGSESEVRGGGRGRGRGRGGRGNIERSDARRLESRAEGQSQGQKELFDPNYTPKPGTVMIQRRGNEGSSSGSSTPKLEEQIYRTPRGPSSTGRGGFGRGGKAG